MAGSKHYYVTSPIYYVNDAPHIGHAYTTLACDVLARFKRLDEFDVKFLTGTDEHGQKVAASAKAAGKEPREFTDQVSENFRQLAKFMNYSHDDFVRTTEDRHFAAARDIWQRLVERDQVYLGTYAGWYAVRDEAFYAEGELSEGPGGKKIAPSGAEVEWVEEPSYFFRLSAWEDKLLGLYRDNPDFVLPQTRLNEVVSFVKGGLQDLSVSRTSFKWGVPVPGDDAHIMYVWLDALTNYITGVGYPQTATGEYATYWPADVHMVGKDIVRFHAVYWPAFLMAADLAPPKRVFAHGWWTNEGRKISKSLGNVIDPFQLVERYGLDAVRYFLLREVPFGNDGDFSHKAMIHRMNGDLANDLGNLAQRVLSLVNKNCAATVPDPGDFTEEDRELTDMALRHMDILRRQMDRQEYHLYLETVWGVIRAANAYVDRQAPWNLKKEDPGRMSSVLYALAETLRRIAIQLHPFMPQSMDRMLDQLAVPEESRSFAFLGADHALTPGTSLPKPQGIFPRFVEDG